MATFLNISFVVNMGLNSNQVSMAAARHVSLGNVWPLRSMNSHRGPHVCQSESHIALKWVAMGC